MSEKVVKPYGNENISKKQEVASMFNNISAKYDFLNHFLSLGIDKLWRKRAVRELKSLKPKRILDIATGTGDFALEALKINPQNVIGVDISEGMLKVGMEKMKAKQVDHIISLRLGDSENLPFDANTFDAITVGFGVRNFENLKKGEPVSIYGSGTQSLDYVYVEDCCEAIFNLTVQSNSSSSIYNISGGTAISINSLIGKIKKVAHTNYAPEIRMPSDWTEGSIRLGKNEKIKRAIGWEPFTSLELGLEKTWNWVSSYD